MFGVTALGGSGQKMKIWASKLSTFWVLGLRVPESLAQCSGFVGRRHIPLLYVCLCLCIQLHTRGLGLGAFSQGFVRFKACETGDPKP